MLPAIYAWRKGKERMTAWSTVLELSKHRLRTTKAEEIRQQVQSCRLLRAGQEEEEEEAEEAVTHSCSQGLLCWWRVSVCTLGCQVWWPHFSHVWCTSDVGQGQKNCLRGKTRGQVGTLCLHSHSLSISAALPRSDHGSLRAVPEAFPVPLVCCLPWGSEEEEKVCTAPVGIR